MPGCCSTWRSSRPPGPPASGCSAPRSSCWRATPFPNAAEQTAFYRRAYEQAGDRPIVFRTLDIGGDKVLPYLAEGRRGQPGDGLARDPHRARPAGDAAAAVAGAAARRRRAGAVRQVPDDQRSRRARRGAPSARHGTAPGSRRRTARGPRSVSIGVMLEVPALLWQLPALLRARRFSVGRHQRSGAVRFRLRPRQSAPRRALRPAVAADAGAAAPSGPGVRRRRQAAQHLRRDGGQPDRGDGADRARLPHGCRWPRPRSGRSRR